MHKKYQLVLFQGIRIVVQISGYPDSGPDIRVVIRLSEGNIKKYFWLKAGNQIPAGNEKVLLRKSFATGNKSDNLENQ